MPKRVPVLSQPAFSQPLWRPLQPPVAVTPLLPGSDSRTELDWACATKRYNMCIKTHDHMADKLWGLRGGMRENWEVWLGIGNGRRLLG